VDLENYLTAKFEVAMRTWSRDLVQDIYALSLYRDDNEFDDEGTYRPSVLFIYNTTSHLMRQLPHATTLSEARWYLAHWQLDDKVDIETTTGDKSGRHRDEEGTRLLDAWFQSQMATLHPEDSSDLIPVFAELCGRVARALHDRGSIRAVFGRDVPIIMHDDDVGEKMLAQTAAVNPPDAVAEFLADSYREMQENEEEYRRRQEKAPPQ
jgi:hypothetical protein